MNSAISTWSWRHRFYAFLLRRALGPFLSKKSAADLHRSILDIDWSEGKLILVDVELDADHLNSFIVDDGLNLCVRRACIRRLALNISLLDSSLSSPSSSDQEASSSRTRMATAAILRSVFGTTSADGSENIAGLSLKVHVDLDGLSFVLSPGKNRHAKTKSKEQHECVTNMKTSDQEDDDMAVPGFFSSLVDSAMKSLRVSINVSGIKIRTCSHYCSSNSGINNDSISSGEEIEGYSGGSSSSACWVDMRIASARYYDLIESNRISATTGNEKTSISKAFDVQGLTIESNSIDSLIRSKSPQTILNSNGVGSIRYTVIEKWSSATSSTEENPLFLSARQKIEVSFGERIAVDVDPTSLSQMVEILNAMKMSTDSEGFVDAYENDQETETDQIEDDNNNLFGDEFYRETYDQIMKQYTEARHLARTRELRGGLLVPAQNEDEELSFDTFFDANDHSHSVSDYYSMTHCNEAESNEDHREENAVDHVQETELVLTLAEFTMKVNLVDDSTRCFRSIMQIKQDDMLDCILMSVGDISLVNYRSGSHSKLTFSLSHFDIESQMAATCGTRLVNECIMRFLQDDDSMDSCVTIVIESLDGITANDCSRRVDIKLHPIEITYQERAITGFLDMVRRLPLPQSSTSENEEAKKKESCSLFISAKCPSIVVMIACQNYSILQNSTNTNRLFQRHGYAQEASGGLFFGLGVELDNVKTDLSLKSASDDSSSPDYRELKASVTSTHALLFAKSTELKRGKRRRQTYVSRRADLVALTREEDRETNAVTISFQHFFERNGSDRLTQPMKNMSAFPIVLPLSSVKAQQESDDSDDEIDDMYEIANKTVHDRVKVNSCGMNASDPQYILSSEANEAEKELSVDIANIFFDITVEERQSLSFILSSFGCGGDERDETDTDTREMPVDRKQFFSLSINVGQIVASLRGQDTGTFSLIVDEIQVHALTASKGVRNLRLLCSDVTLYHLSNFHPIQEGHADNLSLLSAVDRCQYLQSRMRKTPGTVAKAIFFRSKLCRSFSPETPCFLIDILFRNGAVDDYNEIGIHCSFYDMTYRYEMDFDWLASLTVLLKDFNATESDVVDSVDEESALSLFNVSVNLTDCNIDYTPPSNFKTESRVIIKVGGINLTSNIVSPSASVQAFKVSLSDLRLYICNYRYSHNNENTLLSCARRFLNNDDLCTNGHAHSLGRNAVSWEDVLFRMNFVNLIVLDSLDTVILKSNDGKVRRKEPAMGVALTMGHLSIFACQDSFSCFNRTYNEWFIQFTSLSDEELEALRELSESQLEHNNKEDQQNLRHETIQVDAPTQNSQEKSVTHRTTAEVLTSPSHQQSFSRDDIVTMDLTETLLFENYYTIDTTTSELRKDHCRVRHEMIAKEQDDESESSEDDWATVEHDYAQLSDIPPEDDQRAEWIVCKADATDEQHNNSQKVKIFPQHVPVKPLLDPLAESSVDAAKLAGTEVAPDIGLRVIVKDASVTIRLFDGCDYIVDPPKLIPKQVKPEDRRDQLLSNLMGDQDDRGPSLLVTEDCREQSRRDRSRRKQHRNVHKYFEVVLHGLKLKQDSFVESKKHRLASFLDLSISDFYIAEAVSNDDPLKLMGEWMNEDEHPRDNSDGIIMLQIVTKHPALRVSADGKLMSDESQATLELLPLRCYFHQTALRFIRNFFSGDPSPGENDGDGGDDTLDDNNNVIDDDELIDIFFNTFKVRPCKLKVDYIPEKMDVESLRDGNYSEILNLCPLEDMVLHLAAVNNNDLAGWGSIFRELTGAWIEDICSTQAHKFITRAAPVQLLSTLGDGVADLAMVIIVPEDNVSAYLRNIVGGTTSFASKVAIEAISSSAKLTRFAAKQAKQLTRSSPLPTRPRCVPRHALDTAGHAYESLMLGIREANHNIITVPYREYQQSGASGAARSAMRGIPIGIVAPIAGTSEALSYTLLGIRNQLRPDKRREEESSFVAKD